jgi:hypothetical protein
MVPLLVSTDGLDNGQAQDVLWGDERLRKIITASPSWSNYTKGTPLF